MVMAALRCSLSFAVMTGIVAAQFGAHYKADPIHYGRGPTADPITQLRRSLEAGEKTLAHEPGTGYLPALLAAIGAPRSTQGLVFSKTSFQNRLISPANPRAVYFGDEVYVGFVPGGTVLEITAMDPVQGPIFYTLDQSPDGPPRFRRRTDECLTCHGSGFAGDWPANLVRSVYPDAEGHPRQDLETYVTSHESPLRERWGGWYVTGTHGAQRHMGNTIASAKGGVSPARVEAGANLTDLRDRVVTDRYLAPTSDIVALMVLEHQTRMHNLLAAASYRTRRALYLQAATNRALEDADDHVSEATRRQIRDAANEVLEYLLFKNEAPLTAGVAGTSAFAAEFARRGPRDPQGRSLRDFDLQTRLFRHPCSYLIYSPSFDALPASVLEIVYTRLWRILTGRFGRRSWGLERAERQAILEILLATKKGLPASWKRVEVR